MVSAVVVGSGPNGLAAAITLAQRGIDVTVLEASDVIGGGLSSGERTVPGVLHDDCVATVPTALASSFVQSLNLESHGLEWTWPEVDLAHPIDGGRAGVLMRSLDETERLLGVDGRKWRRIFEPLADGFSELVPDIFGPLIGFRASRCGWRGLGCRPSFRRLSSFEDGEPTKPARYSPGTPPTGGTHLVGRQRQGLR